MINVNSASGFTALVPDNRTVGNRRIPRVDGDPASARARPKIVSDDAVLDERVGTPGGMPSDQNSSAVRPVGVRHRVVDNAAVCDDWVTILYEDSFLIEAGDCKSAEYGIAMFVAVKVKSTPFAFAVDDAVVSSIL